MKIIICIAVFFIFIVTWFAIPYSPLKGDFSTDNKTLKEKSILYKDNEVFKETDFEATPSAIQKYIANAGYIGTPKMNSLHMEYLDVDFKQGKNGPNLKIDYIQNNYVKEPARMALILSSMFGIPFQGYDYYSDGVGGMKGVIAKLLTLFDQKGLEMDVACLATFLAESMFFPSVLLQDYISLEEINDHQVKATITFREQKASGIFTFNEKYEMTSFTTKDRAVVNTDGTTENVPWTAACDRYVTGADGIKRPTTFKAIWNYSDGDFIYFDGQISRIDYE
ncbi:MAG: hypothetical protein MJZ05_00345 [Fibrobacter sp.]|nr:hypothetical protein [Fibrobacter sp.]